MASNRITARNASLYIQDSTGASRSISGYLNNISMSRSAEAPDITGFGEDNRQRLSNGIKDWELTFNAFFGVGASGIDEILNGILGGSTMLFFGPSGSTSSCTMYTACAVLTEYAADFALEGAATMSGTLMARSGSMTRTTWS